MQATQNKRDRPETKIEDLYFSHLACEHEKIDPQPPHTQQETHRWSWERFVIFFEWCFIKSELTLHPNQSELVAHPHCDSAHCRIKSCMFMCELLKRSTTNPWRWRTHTACWTDSTNQPILWEKHSGWRNITCVPYNMQYCVPHEQQHNEENRKSRVSRTHFTLW